jgi:type IV secretory pathway VirB4 component
VRTPAHEATTAQLGAVYPCVATRALPANAVLVGRDVFGGLFVHDPFLLYSAGTLTNPNMVVLGQIGRGKSAFVKSYLFRQAAIGRRVVVLDPKGEYGSFAAGLRTSPIVLRPGGPIRLNPLDGVAGVLGTPPEPRALSLLADLAASCLGRPLSPEQHAAIELALTSMLRRGSRLVLPTVVESLLEPDRVAAREINCSVEDLRQDGREIGLELRRFVSGEFSGMFDGETSPGVDLDAPVVVIDLSALYHSPALGALLSCVSAAMRRSWAAACRSKSFFVVDEAWAMLQNPGATRFLQSSLKLARARGVSNVIVAHRASDFASSGSDVNTSTRIAEGLLSDCETLVCFAQADAELDGARRLFGLSDTEVRLLSRLGRGRALWRVGHHAFLVEHRLSSFERTIVDTDAALSGDHLAG